MTTTSYTMLFTIIVLITNIVLQTTGYLQQIEINSINDLYNSLGGKYWTGCEWNITMINDTNVDNIITDDCQILHFVNDTKETNLQYLNVINFQATLLHSLQPTLNVTGFIPWSIGNFAYLTMLGFWYNDIYGDIPSEICKLNLNSFVIMGTNLHHIPSCVFDFNLVGLELSNSKTLLVNDKNIQQLCNNKHIKYKFASLLIQNVNYTGSIPECIGNDLLMLTQLQFMDIGQEHNPIKGVIPSSINNLGHLSLLSLYNIVSEQPKNYTIHLTIKRPKLLTTLQLDLDLVNINLYDLCNASNLYVLQLTANDESNNLVHVPMDCLLKRDNQIAVLALGGSGLVGTINQVICNQKGSLRSLSVSNTKHMHINMPECLLDFYNLGTLFLDNNPNLHSLPTQMINSSVLFRASITGNVNLQTKIATLFTKDSFRILQVLSLNDNDFFDENIDELLHNIFINSPNLISFSLHGNKYLSGSLPSINHHVFIDYLQILTLHDLDLYGTISNHLHLSRNVSINHTILITLQNNRLSGTIPANLFENINFDPIILLGNKFQVNDKNDNQWLQQNSLFMDVSALYISKMDNVKSYAIVSIALSSILLYLILLFTKKRLSNKLMTYWKGKEEILFLYNLDIINNLLINPILLCVSTSFIIFYACNSNYYQENTFLSRFSLYNYYSKDIYVNVTFAVLTLLFNIIIMVKVKQINESMSQTAFNKLTERVYDNERKHHCRIYTNKLCVCILYFFALIIVMSFVFGYGLFSSLPAHNVFTLNSYSSLKAVTLPLSLVLAISKSIIIPNFTNSLFNTFNISYKHRNKCIMVLRTIIAIIIPFISSIFFINECGGEWSLFWNNCQPQNKHQFDVNATITTQEIVAHPNDTNRVWWAAPQTVAFTNLLTSKEVCNISIPSANNVEKCLREFFDLWTNVLFESMIIMIFMPIFIVIYKFIRYTCKNNKGNDNKFCIRIDSAYVMITNKLEICLIFTLICPLILPLIIVILKWNELFYYIMIRKFKWNVTFSYNIDMPTKFLYFSLFMSHLFSFLFLFYYQYAINKNYNVIVSILFIIIIVIAYILLWLYHKINEKNKSINDNHVVKLIDNQLHSKRGSINRYANKDLDPVQN